MSDVVPWLSPEEAERVATAAARTLDANLMREVARAIDGRMKSAPRKAATKRCRQLLAVADGCAKPPKR